jgi:Xaa-Pro dipeptidase
MMRTILTGKVSKRHQELYDAARAAVSLVEKAMTPGNTFGDVFDAHARALETHDLTRHRLNACGYSVGARFAPSWMDTPMFYQGNSEVIAPNMTLFAHLIIVDSEAEAAMTLGRTYLTTETQPRPLSRHDLDLIVK